jgi:hypothetical protein
MAVVSRLCALFLVPFAAWAGMTADYSIDPIAIDGGGATAYSADYTLNVSTACGAAGASANYSLRSGYAGQLLDLAGIPPPTVASISPSSGSTLGGTSVTITGTNLTSASDVTIGGTAATSVNVVDSTTITATTPAGSEGTASVLVTTLGGTNRANTLYTYVAPPTVPSISPTSGSTLGGTSVTITGTNFTNASDVTIGGTAATSVNVVDSSTITATTPAGSAGTASVLVTTPGGTNAANTLFTYVAPLTVASISPTSGSTLGGTSVTITGTNFTGATGVTIGGTAATSVSVVNATTITATTPAGSTGTASVLVTTPNGTNAVNTLYTFGDPEIAIEQPALTDLIDGSASVAFGTRNVAETSSLTFTVKNTGTLLLNIGTLTFTGANATDFSVTTAPAASVATAGSTTFVIAFTPVQSGARSAVLHLVNNDASGDENPFDITLTGTGENLVGSALSNSQALITVQNGDFTVADLSIKSELAFAPSSGSTYTLIDVVNPSHGVIGSFNDLPDGGVIAMNYNGVIYYFQADYTGGSGNDITLTNFSPDSAPSWKWVAGPNKRNNAANFGLLNVADATNNPGSRQGAMNWLGTDGNLWMFGGYGYAKVTTKTPNGLNDLWQYDRTLGRWIWRSGSSAQGAAGVYGSITVEAAGSTPSSRHSGSTWTDSNNSLWLFGGVTGSSRNNDLWRYRPSTGRWTWMKGSKTTGQASVYGTQGIAAAGNTPGARQGAASWFTPDGNLWLFGGFNGTAYFNDLWSYNLASGMWTWVSGSNTTNANGAYGTVHIESAANVPGARRDATGGWVSKDGSLWMFGGLGLPATGSTAGNLNDLWHFNRATRRWTWIKGSNTINPIGVYGTQGTPDAANIPGGRSAGSGWATVDGKFWLIGGFVDSKTIQSDVWIYDESANEWVWMQGAKATNASGVYGTLGVADSINYPGARFTPSTWVTLNGFMWIFGGGGPDSLGTLGRLSDLWSYGIPPPTGAPIPPATVPFPASFTINVDPTVNNATASTIAYVPVSGQLAGNDSDGDVILYGTTGTTLSHGTLTLQSNGQWTYAPAPGYVGTDTFTFKASDYYGGQSPTRTLTITVATNPADADNDGIADSYELSTFGSIGADSMGDADGDGQTNYFEYLAGTSPVDAAQTLTTAPSIAAGASASGGSFKLNLSRVRPGLNYHLETSSDLDVWNRIGTFTFSVSGSATIEAPTAPTGQPAFYRINLQAPTLLP